MRKWFTAHYGAAALTILYNAKHQKCDFSTIYKILGFCGIDKVRKIHCKLTTLYDTNGEKGKTGKCLIRPLFQLAGNTIFGTQKSQIENSKKTLLSRICGTGVPDIIAVGMHVYRYQQTKFQKSVSKSTDDTDACRRLLKAEPNAKLQHLTPFLFLQV